ncbi:ABC-type transport system involved in cytochrome c biogenesis ATPase subunit [Pseudomonas sp. SORGH_AS 211]|uniref:AAA family ATPase n=1 Tax=Pseudomonas sp. SORGH_AS_0211 TaxID=3041796 RepID=UPI00285671CD|nr:AAA family ATPase [Pseudomonas sp. SORGH_AS_0211]MDR6179241.1 ABC-type transport system involved in cytochrome c biogenesis ATPase subunit [Pseudomonas sp. SORGH_AS_0211]
MQKEDTLPYDVFDVFTPSQPAKLSFIDRETINSGLVNALRTPGKQIVVYGHSGSGKTTLLSNKLYQTYEGHITSQCMKGMSFEQLVIDAFDQLAPYYEEQKSTKESATSKASLAATYKSIKLALEASHTSEYSKNEKRALPPQLTPQSLGRLLGSSKKCWVIEDFHKIDETEKQKLSQLLKVFMDLAPEHRLLKIICLGAVDTARQVVAYDEEMRRRVAEIHVPLMSDQEIYQIVNKGEELLNIRFPSALRSKVAKHACGVASICHQLCLNMCIDANVIGKQGSPKALSDKNFDRAVEMYIEDASDSLRGAFDKALKQRNKTKFDSSRLIIEALAFAHERGLARLKLLSRIQENSPSYTDAILKIHIKKLLEAEYGSILRHDSDSGLYSFKDPFYRAYAQTIIHTENNDHAEPLSTSAMTSHILVHLRENLIIIEHEEHRQPSR